MAAPLAAEAWTEERQIKQEEKKPLVRLIECTKKGKVKDLTKVPINRVPYTSTASRSKKALKMQSKYVRDRPVPKGTSLPGMEEDAQAQPYFLPSEKPSTALKEAQMDPINRKTVSEYTRTMESRSARTRRLSRQNAFFKVLNRPEDLETGYSPSTPTDLRRVSSVRERGPHDEMSDVTYSAGRQKTSTSIGDVNPLCDLPEVSSTISATIAQIEQDLLNNNLKPGKDFLSTRNALLKKSQSIAAGEKPSFLNRSNSSGSTFTKSNPNKTLFDKKETERPLDRPNSGLASFTPRRASKLTNSVSMRTSRDISSFPRETVVNGVNPRRVSNERLPVYDKTELESRIDEIDVMLPGVCISPRPPTVRPSTKMRPSRTPTCCSCCSLCDTPKSQLFQTMTPFELQHPDIYKRDKSKVMPHCSFCQVDEMKKNVVQYCHGDVIHTFDWLMKDAKETPL